MRSTLNDRVPTANHQPTRQPLQLLPSQREAAQQKNPPLSTNREFENLLGMIHETKRGFLDHNSHGSEGIEGSSMLSQTDGSSGMEPQLPSTSQYYHVE